MDLVQLLDTQRDAILADAADALAAARLTHYDSLDANRRRLRRLYDLALRSVSDRDLVPMVDYAAALARERFEAGFDLQEVHTAFNVLEEAIWKAIAARIPPAGFPEAFGLASTVLGAGKQTLACEYVSLASRTKVRSLDLSRLFQGA
jgi:hypothetical protein